MKYTIRVSFDIAICDIPRAKPDYPVDFIIDLPVRPIKDDYITIRHFTKSIGEEFELRESIQCHIDKVDISALIVYTSVKIINVEALCNPQSTRIRSIKKYHS